MPGAITPFTYVVMCSVIVCWLKQFAHYPIAGCQPNAISTVAGCQPNAIEGEPGCQPNIITMSWLRTARWVASTECHHLCWVGWASGNRLDQTGLQTIAAFLYPSLIAVLTQDEVVAISQSDTATSTVYDMSRCFFGSNSRRSMLTKMTN